MRVLRVLVLVFLGVLGLSTALRITGDAYLDFTDNGRNPATGKPYNYGVARVPDAPKGLETKCNGQPCPDVSVPSGFGTSGWDIRNIFFQYDQPKDALLIGIDCFGVCGDADGDGFEGGTSMRLSAIGGVDYANLARSESFGVALDFNLDVVGVADPFSTALPFDFIIGVPSSQTASSLPCGFGVSPSDPKFLSSSSCFGLYRYRPSINSELADRFLDPVTKADATPWSVSDLNPNPTSVKPDIIWQINDVTALRTLAGSIVTNNKAPWSLIFQAYGGSKEDASIGEEYVPSKYDWVDINFPCLELDACDVCLGDGSTCRDCAGVLNGPARYDVCDVCNGKGNSCLDCRGVPNGPAVYDLCGVCNGGNRACADCAGVPFGTSSYDACDVCNGNSRTCRDCSGVPNGGAIYDSCDVCNGNHKSCQDCAGIPNGGGKYDVCDVCNGDGSSCRDCRGVANGPAFYDVCDVCNGNGMSCLDCAGVPNGPNSYDICGVCNGRGDTCDDCNGVPLGNCTYDHCGVCCGDSTSCMDCAGVPNGSGKLDSCGVCNGDGSSCVCLKIHNLPTPEVDHALLEWTIVATIDRISHTVEVLEGIKEELGRYNVKRGNLASDVSHYLDTANEFRDVLDNFCYVQVWFKDALDEALHQL